MLMVLVHPHGALSPGLSRLLIQLLPRLLLSALFCLLAANLPTVAAQSSDDTQPPSGLSVLDAPAHNSVLKAGQVTGVAIDVNAGIDGRGFTYDSLEVYIVSSQTNANVTVAAGPQLLAQEPGSTVKHINWLVPTCLTSGDYNLTMYEASTFNGSGFFAIMPIPVRVQNDSPVSPCASDEVHPLEAQPQPSSPPPVALLTGQTSFANPSSPSTPSSTSAAGTGIPSPTDSSNSTLDGSATPTPAPNSTLTSGSPQETGGGGIITVTVGDGDITIPLSDLPGTIVVEPSGGAPPDPNTTTTGSSGFITIFKTVAPTATATLTEIISQPITITLEETFVSTETEPGLTREFTVTQTLLSTIQLVATQVSSPEQAGLLPVNAAVPSAITISTLWALWVPAFICLLRPLLAL